MEAYDNDQRLVLPFPPSVTPPSQPRTGQRRVFYFVFPAALGDEGMHAGSGGPGGAGADSGPGQRGVLYGVQFMDHAMCHVFNSLVNCLVGVHYIAQSCHSFSSGFECIQ